MRALRWWFVLVLLAGGRPAAAAPAHSGPNTPVPPVCFARDDSAPGIGNRKLSTIRPEERTTPAGRFVAALGHDFKHDILWIDYGAAISLHRVIRGTPGDHRLERLATTSPLDKRITYGCVNVPVKFYEEVVLRTFTGTTGIVYILPEIKTIQDVFPAFPR